MKRMVYVFLAVVAIVLFNEGLINEEGMDK